MLSNSFDQAQKALRKALKAAGGEEEPEDPDRPLKDEAYNSETDEPPKRGRGRARGRGQGRGRGRKKQRVDENAEVNEKHEAKEQDPPLEEIPSTQPSPKRRPKTPKRKLKFSPMKTRKRTPKKPSKATSNVNQEICL